MVYILTFILLIFTRQNAVIFTLCRNEDLNGISTTIANFEKRFNSVYKYPYVFLNDKAFTDEFKTKMSTVTENRATFGQIKPEDWDMPENINKSQAMANWKIMSSMGVPYAEKESYHNMCRYFSRKFYKNELVSQYDYYWRIEPDVKFHCDIDFDPFDYMANNRKKYGFVITIYEFMETIKSLMTTTAEFLQENDIPKKDNLRFMFNNGKYNGCHFWSNFEIASFDFLRSDIYNKYVDHLEKSGGFYTERWGDAPVHSIAASLFLDKDEIHFFDNIGYTHAPMMHCPKQGKNCDCVPSASVDNTNFSCLPKYLNEVRGSN